ncbi:hypothetical protein KSP40_PGU017460 [Platanthera guangdongensis]|uniref:Uncharacterized protein n=1 Tax=Platanthera guangdongensis TaxID=2320717 RepID=A0ABR2MRV3_9ASPA
MIDVVITIRGSLEAAGLGNEPQSPTAVLITGEQEELEDAVYVPVPVPVRENSCVHQVALMFTTVFLLRQLVIILFFSSDNYATTLATAFLIRSVCILLPSYVVVRLISAFRKARSSHYEIAEVATIYHDIV